MGVDGCMWCEGGVGCVFAFGVWESLASRMYILLF